MDLTDLIQSAVREGRFAVSHHAHRRLRERRIELWQVKVGMDEAVVVEERPQDQPNPSIVTQQALADGTTVVVIWAWSVEENQALLVTVFFPD